MLTRSCQPNSLTLYVQSVKMEFTQLSPEQILELGKPCDELTQALETKKPTPQLDWSNSQKAVATLRYVVNMMDQRDKPDPDVQEKTVDVPVRDGTAISMKIFQPAQHDDGPRGPLIVLFFAGGFVMGSPSTLGVLARPLVKRFKATVVAPAYRLAPEHPFPIAVHDAWDAVQWVGSNAHSISADPAKGFIVGGISSGALLANVVVHLAKDADAAPKISGAFLCCGSARVAAKDAEKLPESYRQRNLSRYVWQVHNAVPELRLIYHCIDRRRNASADPPLRPRCRNCLANATSRTMIRNSTRHCYGHQAMSVCRKHTRKSAAWSPLGMSVSSMMICLRRPACQHVWICTGACRTPSFTTIQSCRSRRSGGRTRWMDSHG